MKQLTTKEDLEGKTILKVCTYDNIAIHFTDDTFVIIEKDYDYPIIMTDYFHTGFTDFNSYELLRLGFKTKEEYDTFIHIKEEVQKEKQERQERELYESLKAKFN